LLLCFDEEIKSHWRALMQFNTIFDNMVVSYFLGHPV